MTVAHTFLNQWKDENDRRKYFTINLHESMGPGLAGIKLMAPKSVIELTTNCPTGPGSHLSNQNLHSNDS